MRTHPRRRVRSEQVILAVALCGLHDSNSIIDQVEPEYFSRDAHRLIFQAMQELRKRDEGIDVISVSNELRKSGNLEAIGGSPYIMDLAMSRLRELDAERHIALLKESALQFQGAK